MGRLIDADAASEIVRFECGKWEGLANTIIKEFYALKPVDAVPVRHGYWINIMEGNALRRKCSVCGEVFIANSDKHDFCGCCGADMRKDGDGND